MKKNLVSVFSLIVVLAFVFSFVPARPAYAISADVVISQVYGGGGNLGATYRNDFVELFNRGTQSVDVTGWTVQYASATGSSWAKTTLSGSIGAGNYYLVQEAAGTGGTVNLPAPDATGSIAMSSSAGKVALVNNNTMLTGTCPTGLVDFVGFGGANCSEASPTPALSNTTAALRNNNGCVDTDSNVADFAVAAPAPRNSASPTNVCPVVPTPTNPTGTGAATPNVVVPDVPVLVTVAVKPGANPTSTGLAVSCDLSAIGGSAPQALFDDGSNGDATAGDNTFSFSANVGAATTIGAKSLACTIKDDQGRTGSASIALTVTQIIPIGTVNGPVLDTDNGTAHVSPYVGQTVVVQGVIYENTLQAANSTAGYNRGFFIQNTATTADSDPNTSDGVFVFVGGFPSLIGGYAPQVGDEVVLSGRVTEFNGLTELSSARMLKVVGSGADLDAEVPALEVDPPTALADANRYWERRQGMRLEVPADSLVLGGRNVFSPADAEIWVARGDSTVATRSAPFERRAFRDAHILDDNYDVNNWDGNGYRILLGSLGIKSTLNDKNALIVPARTFSTLDAPVVGGLNYTFSKYRIEVTDQPSFTEGVDPSTNNPPESFDRNTGYSIADYNVENLYDYRDNPFSGCDFNNAANAGCSNTGTPFIDPIKPSYNYVPANDDDYQTRLEDIASQIVNELHSPDVLMLQEVENQDICSVSGGALTCGDTNNADGKPDDLQELALKIADLGGPVYDAAFDRDSSDLRGIVPSFMYRTDRVTLASPVGDPVLGANPAIPGYTPVDLDGDVSNPKTLNAVLPASVTACETSWVFPRAPDVGLFRIYNETAGVGPWHDVYLINNHFKSGPDSCVEHRRQQANYNAALANYIESKNPQARVIVGGDLNVYPRPDDPFAPIGQLGSSDQLGALYDTSNLTNLWDVLLSEHPESAYSYVFVGMAQTLDQMFVNPLLLGSLGQYRIAHVNSDFAAEDPTDVARGTSDHDPNVAKFNMFHASGLFQPVDALPELNVVKAGSSIPVKFSLDGDQGLNVLAAGYPASVPFVCDSSMPTDAIEETSAAGASGLSYDPTTDTYTYAWKTSKAWGGTCRQLTVILSDGTTFQADFKFTK